MECFDICILSTGPDAPFARKLAESIRRYRLPSNAKPADPALDYRRILLDCEDEPFGETVRMRLENSRNLVLLCSPRTKNDPTIHAKLASFRAVHDPERIVLCIVEGEPSDSFPESFIEKKTVQHILPDMSVVERIETIEPNAADLRGATERARRTVLRYETVRITASVLGMHPDELEQRHRSRRRRAAAAVLAMVGMVCLAAAGIFLRLGLIARAEGQIAEEQTKLSLSIAHRTIEELPASFAEDEQALAYIDEAIQSAREELDALGLADRMDEAETGGGA